MPTITPSPASTYLNSSAQTRVAKTDLRTVDAGARVATQPPPEKADKGTQLRQRPKPVLANRRSVCKETKRLAKGEPLIKDMDALVKPVSVLPTTYAGRANHTKAQNLASNLLLDLNLYLEENLQRAMEELPNAVRDIKKVVQLVHQMMNVDGLPADISDMTAHDLLEARLTHVRGQLAGNYTPAQLDDYFGKRNGTDTRAQQFMRDASPPLSDEQVLYVKLLKMLFGQLPYFGGSVEYKMKQVDSLEFWIYHMSTITRDPRRSLLGEPGAEHMLKPMRDYITPEGSLMNVNNQKNLGTGVAEVPWKVLPMTMQRAIRKYLMANIDTSGTTGNAAARQRKAAAYHALVESVRADVADDLDDLAEDSPGVSDDIRQLWDQLSEDQKKVVYGDLAGLPWSETHLQHLGSSFEADFDRREARYSNAAWVERLPEIRGLIGLPNVTGVHGNVLQKPLKAGERYRKELMFKTGGGVPRIRNASGGVDQMTDKEVKDDFVDKQTAWFHNAYNNHRPIIGGMSGHALAYLNLYKDALAAAGAGAGAPSLEKLRALLLAGLVGDKRHHSYDEVIAASKGMVAGDETLDYGDRVGYGDVLQSRDPDIRHHAGHALADAARDYETYERGTVLATLGEQDAALREDLLPHVAAYYEAVRAGTADHAQLCTGIAAVIARHLPAMDTADTSMRPVA